jgi:uncharacterized membrane protein YheB (UPF0754 family)
MKIQINSLEALERLIGGDTQLEFDIRQNIVEEFTKKHLKSLANSTLMARTEQDIVKAIKIGASHDLIIQRIDEYLNKEVVRKKIENLLNKQSDFIVGQLSDMMLKLKIEQLVDQKIKEKLGLKL